MLTLRRAQSVLAFLALALLSGCGFHLRGNAEVRLPVKSIYIGLPANSPLRVSIVRNIEAAGGTEIVNDPNKAEAVLEVVEPERRERTVLSLNGAGQPIEFTLLYRFSFHVRDNNGHELIPVTPFTLKRDMSFNSSYALAKETEADNLYKDMQQDLAMQVMRRLSAMKLPE
ncbi:MAG TPA: LPS assembly lipoprotein LptE [Burkholderiaceae bacterium]